MDALYWIGHQSQPDQAQWNGGGYYGYAQGYEAYGYAPPPQDPNMYYGAYPGYGNYQQPQQVSIDDSSSLFFFSSSSL